MNNIDLEEPADRVKLFRIILDKGIETLVKTEKNCSIIWPAYCATVDTLKEFIFAMAGYHSPDEADEAGKSDDVHDLACSIAASIFNYMREKGI